MNIQERICKIQQELKAPKSQFNKFGGYKYRNCEDILEAVKPFLEDASLIITDEIVNIGERYYIKATAILRWFDEKGGFHNIQTQAYAREPESKKGMDPSQITGAASSYARKYALNGLFCIDDTRDADTHGQETTPPKPKPAAKPQKETLTSLMERFFTLCNEAELTPDERLKFMDDVKAAKNEENFEDIVSDINNSFDDALKWWYKQKGEK